jgi:hypothetical protein
MVAPWVNGWKMSAPKGPKTHTTAPERKPYSQLRIGQTSERRLYVPTGPALPSGPKGRRRKSTRWSRWWQDAMARRDPLRMGPDFLGRLTGRQTSPRCARVPRGFRGLLRKRSIEKSINRSGIGGSFFCFGSRRRTTTPQKQFKNTACRTHGTDAERK